MKFLIHGPGYDPQSGGVRVLHYLGNLLALNGEDVVASFPQHKFFPEVPDVVQSNKPDGRITIYPDCVRGNPLNAQKIVRYMLYYAGGHFGGDRIPDTELPIIHDDWLFEEVKAHCDGEVSREHIVRVPGIEPNLFYPEGKTVDSVFYQGKGPPEKHECKQVVTRESHTREEAAALLRRTRQFFTSDSRTGMSIEALLCGCESFVLLAGVCCDFPEDNPNRWVMNPERDKFQATLFASLCHEAFGD